MYSGKFDSYCSATIWFHVYFSQGADVVSVDKDLNESFKKLSKSIFKIGDLGHVSRARSSNDPASDTGDARFISIERFQETWIDLKKSDIFSLGLT